MGCAPCFSILGVSRNRSPETQAVARYEPFASMQTHQDETRRAMNFSIRSAIGAASSIRVVEYQDHDRSFEPKSRCRGKALVCSLDEPSRCSSHPLDSRCRTKSIRFMGLTNRRVLLKLFCQLSIFPQFRDWHPIPFGRPHANSLVHLPRSHLEYWHLVKSARPECFILGAGT